MEVNPSLQKSRHSLDSALVTQNGTGLSWRPSSFVNIDKLRKNNPVLECIPPPTANGAAKTPAPSPSTETPQVDPGSQSTQTPVEPPNTEKPKTGSLKWDKSVRNTIVNIVLVEAKGLPDTPSDGSHGVYCKFKLGTQTVKSKSVQTTKQPQWRERLKLHLSNDQLLNLSLWDKGKKKNFMGSCVIDLSTRERERTHDIWQDLDGGYGSVHLSVTMCVIRNTEEATCSTEPKDEDLKSKYAFYNLSADIDIVGQLHVKVIGARGLYGKPSAYCTLELDNEKVQTPSISSNAEPVWNKSYVFNIYDVTSSLELKVCNSSMNAILNDFLGRVTIPLLRINDGEARWYALKDNSKRKSARGNCPRVRLEMNIYWNPVIASLKLFQPKQVKYITKPPKFDIPLIYNNVKFIRDTFEFLYDINESFKSLFEWDDREYATIVLLGWLFFWYYIEMWMSPLLILLAFPIFWILDTKQRQASFMRTQNVDDLIDQGPVTDLQNGETISAKVKGLPEMTITITNGIEYMVSVAERLYNLVTFKVPFLSYLTIMLLIGASVALYLIPYRYFMIAFGLYKFGRKRFNPNRVLNNDLLDFISRIPDNKILRDWKELSVPEPHQPENPVRTSVPSVAS